MTAPPRKSMPHRGPPLATKLAMLATNNTAETRMNGRLRPKKSKFVFLKSSMRLVGPALDDLDTDRLDQVPDCYCQKATTSWPRCSNSPPAACRPVSGRK